MQIKGTVKRVLETQQVSDKFSKREIHVELPDGQYPQTVSVEFTQDKTALLDSVAAGQEVTIDINLRGREWTSPQGETKVFNTLQGWRIAAEGAAAPQQPNATPEPDNDLPF
jgi:hypothetical protein